jgi:hypothetical protein
LLLHPLPYNTRSAIFLDPIFFFSFQISISLHVIIRPNHQY